MRRRGPIVLLMSASALFSWQAEAGYEVVAGVGLETTDNVFLQEEDGVDDMILSERLGLRFDSESPVLEAEIDGDVRYFHYTENTTDDQTLFDLSAAATWHAVPDRLQFVFQDEASEVRGNPRDRGAPDSTQSANAYVVGPDVLFGPSRVDRLIMSARYGESWFENGVDSERVGVGARWLRELSARDGVFLGVQRQQITFTEEDPVATDFERDDVFVGWSRTLPQTEIDVEVGSFEVRREDMEDEDLRGEQAQFSWVQATAPRTNITFRATTAVEDSGARLLSGNDSALSFSGTDAVVTGDLVDRTEYEVGINKRGPYYDLLASVVSSEEDYEVTANDLEAVGGRVAVDYYLAQLTSIGTAISFNRQEFLQSDRVDEDVTVRIEYRRGLSERLFMNLGYTYDQRDSSEANQSFEANRVAAGISYRWGPGLEN